MFGREAAIMNDLRLAHVDREESDAGAAAAHLSDLEMLISLTLRCS